MKNFKVGDKVRLKKGVKVGEVYNGLSILKSMKFRGVKEITDDVPQTQTVLIAPFYYGIDALEKVEEGAK